MQIMTVLSHKTVKFISNYREPLPAMTGIGAANFMESEAIIKIEVPGRFNSLGVFRGFIRLRPREFLL